MPATPSSVTRAVDGQGDEIATLVLDDKHVQVTTGPSLALQFDEASYPVCYLGHALPGTLEAAATWRICKLDFSSGVATTWADGNTNFDNAWSLRATLTYS